MRILLSGLLAAALFLAPAAARAQLSGGVTTTGPFNPGDVPAFVTKNRFQSAGQPSALPVTPAGGSAASALSSLVARAVLTPFDFGAKGDNVTDDTAAVQAAINATPIGATLACGVSGATFYLGTPTTTTLLSTTGTTAIGSNQLTALGSTVGIAVGETVAMAGVPAGTSVLGVVGNVATMSANASANGTGIAVALQQSQFLTLPHAIDFGKGCRFRYAGGTVNTDLIRFFPSTANDYDGWHPHDFFYQGAGALRHAINIDMAAASGNNLFGWQVDHISEGTPIYSGAGAGNPGQVGHFLNLTLEPSNGFYTIRDGTVGPRNRVAGCIYLHGTLDHITIRENTIWYRSAGDTDCGWDLSTKPGTGAGKLSVLDNTSVANGGVRINGAVSPVVTGNYIEQTNTATNAATGTITVSGAIVNGDSGIVTVTPPNGTAVPLTINIITADTTSTVAAKIATAINGSTALQAAGVFAQAVGTVASAYGPFGTAVARTNGASIVFTTGVGVGAFDLTIGSNAGPGAIVADNLLTSVAGNTTLQLSSTSGIAVGQSVTGTNIPGGSTISAVGGDSNHLWVQLSSLATGTIAQGAPITIGGNSFTTTRPAPIQAAGILNAGNNTLIDSNWFFTPNTAAVIANAGSNLTIGPGNIFNGVTALSDGGTGTRDFTAALPLNSATAPLTYAAGVLGLPLGTGLAAAGGQLQVNGNNAFGQPSLKVGLAANQTLTNTTWTKALFDTVLTDSGSYWSASNHNYKPLVAGTYQVCYTALITGTFTGGGLNLAGLSKNGLWDASHGVSVSERLDTGSNDTLSECTQVALNGSTDTIELDVNFTATAGSPALASGGIAFGTQMTATRIGP